MLFLVKSLQSLSCNKLKTVRIKQRDCNSCNAHDCDSEYDTSKRVLLNSTAEHGPASTLVLKQICETQAGGKVLPPPQTRQQSVPEATCALRKGAVLKQSGQTAQPCSVHRNFCGVMYKLK